MPKLVGLAVTVFVSVVSVSAQQPAASAAAARFAGTWVGTQSWAIANPPPGSRQDQPVTLTIEAVDGKITGTLTPFLGGEEGATIVDATIVGDELRATAVIGRPRPGAPAAGQATSGRSAANPARQGGRRGGGPANWKDATRIAFAFHNEGLQERSLVGTADVTMSDVPWMKFKYELAKKRSRY